MIAAGKFAKALSAIAAATLALTACSSEADQEAGTDEEHPLQSLVAADADPDERAAGAGTSMAMELGFDQVQVASDDELAEVRENASERAGETEEMSVDPQSCAPSLAALDWSPILASSDATTRVDFGRSNFMGAGSIEVAGITEATGAEAEATDQVAAHREAVEEITTNCNDLTMMLADESEPDWAELEYTFSAEPIETESGSGLLWQRYPTDEPEGQTTTALTLMTEHEGYMVMVAFIGSDEITDAEFQDISEAVLSSALGQLEQ